VVRVCIASVGFAVAFAAGAQRPAAPLTLLQQLAKRMEIQLGRRPKSSRRAP